MNLSRKHHFLIVAVGALALAACGKHQASESASAAKPAEAAKPAAQPAMPAPTMAVSSVQVGSSVDDKGMVTSSGLTFSPKDTIYAVVMTESSSQAEATVAAKWTFGDQVVNNSEQKVSSNGMATTEFHISKPDGFPAGTYTVQISVNGKVESTINFEVK